MGAHLDKDTERFIRATRVLGALAKGPHAAGQLVEPAQLDRADVDRALRWLQRRRLVEHVGAWRLTELGRIATHRRPPDAAA